MNHLAKRCSCVQCRVRSFAAPVILITLGTLFLLAEYTTHGFEHWWPVLIIVIGLMSLLQSAASREGHIES